MKRILLASLLLLAAAAPGRAQQQPQFTHFGYNGLYLNPGYAGIRGQTEVNAIFRYQYLGLTNSFGDESGSPRTGMVSASVPVLDLNGGVGLAVYYDVAGPTKLTNAALSYSQHVKLGNGQLGIGVQGIFTYLSKGSYRAIDQNDPQVPESGSDRKFDAGAGLWYEGPKLYVGLSANNLFRSIYTLQSAVRNDSQDPNKITGYQNTSRYLGENHAYLTAGYNIEMSPTVTLTPQVLVKAVLPGNYDVLAKYNNQRNYSLEGGIRAAFNDQFSAGLNYRQDESVSGLLGYAFGPDNRYRVSGAFDFIAFDQSARAFASYELLLTLRLPKAVRLTRPPVRTPRYSF